MNEVTVTVQMEGSEYILRPTLQAIQAISRQHGGIVPAVERLKFFDFETVCDVIAAGLSANPNQRAKQIPDLVYHTGTISLAAPCIEYLNLLMRGGRAEPVEDTEDAPEAEG